MTLPTIQPTVSTDTLPSALKKIKFSNWTQVGLTVGVGLIAAPIVGIAITGIAGLIATGVMGLSAVALAPVVSKKLANLKYRALEAEEIAHIKKITAAATEDPIETLQKAIVQNEAAFERFQADVTKAISDRDSFNAECDEFCAQYPARAQEFLLKKQQFHQRIEQQKVALRGVQTSIGDAKLKLKEMRAYWKMSNSVISMNKSAGMDIGDKYAQLKIDTASDAVFERMNDAFAHMEVAAALEIAPAPPSLAPPAIPSQAFGVTDTHIMDVIPKTQSHEKEYIKNA